MRRWHYSESAEVAPKYIFSIVLNYALQGLIIYGKPAMNQIYKQYSDDPEGIIELRRMVLIDATPKNTESWFLGKSLNWLAKNTDEKIVVTYADPMMGHSGSAYKACNFIYDGLSGNSPAIELEDGRIVHDRLLRCRTKNGNLSSSAIQLHKLIVSGKARRVERPSKHRYHFHLDRMYSCKWCSGH